MVVIEKTGGGTSLTMSRGSSTPCEVVLTTVVMMVVEERAKAKGRGRMAMTSPSTPCEVVLTTVVMMVVEERAKAKGRGEWW